MKLLSLFAGCSHLCLPCVKGGGPLCGGGIVFRPTLVLTKRCFLSITIPQSAPLTAPFTQGSQTGETASVRILSRRACRTKEPTRKGSLPVARSPKNPYGFFRGPHRARCRRGRLKGSGKDRKTREKRQGDETPSVAASRATSLEREAHKTPSVSLREPPPSGGRLTGTLSAAVFDAARLRPAARFLCRAAAAPRRFPPYKKRRASSL